MPGQPVDVRIGPYWCSLAEGLDDPQLGFSFRRFPIARRWESLLAPSQSTDGTPGLRNIRSDDLRWVQTDFSGGQGQRVFAPDDPDGARRFESSEGVDFSVPGEIRLGRAMSQIGSTGTAPVTYQGDTFSDSIGTSTVVNTTDRRLNTKLDRVTKDTASLGTGTYLFDFYAYLADSTAIVAGSSLLEDLPTVTFPGGAAKLHNLGARARSGNRTPCPSGETDVPVAVTFTLRVDNSGGTGVWTVKWKLTVYDQTNSQQVATKFVEATVPTGTHDVTGTINFTAETSTTNYRYRAEWTELTYVGGGTGGVAPFTRVEQFQEYVYETKEVKWEVLKSGVVQSSGTVELTSLVSTKIASTTIVVGSAAAYTMRLQWLTGSSQKPVLDKTVSTQLTMGDPWLAELGNDDRIWLVDYNSGAAANVFWWDPQNAKWSVVSTVGASGSKPVAMAHSDNYEFVAMDNKIVYRAKRPSTTAAVTSATTDAIVGIAVGGGRLWVLTMSATNGPELYEGDSLEANPITLTLRSTGMSLPKGNQPDTTLPNQIAGTADGCVFFANDGPDCRLYQWTNSGGSPTGTNLVDGGFPRGFRARALTHGLGYTWVAGGMPVFLSDGTTRYQPALFMVSPDGSVSPIDAQLYLEGETAKVQSVQLYGTDLWVWTEVPGTPLGRLWRVDLVTQGAFLMQTITPDETQTSGTARAAAVTWNEKVLVWSKGSPYLESDDYSTYGTHELVSSRYTFGLTEQKVLYVLDIVADIPTGTSVEVSYAVDDGDWMSAGTATVSGSTRLVISTPASTVRGAWAQFKVSLASTNVDATPRVYQVGLRAFLNEWRKAWEVLVQAASETANYHAMGQQLTGGELASRLFALMDSGGVVEFEDHFSDPSVPATYTVQIIDPEQIVTNAGESFVRLILLEREG